MKLSLPIFRAGENRAKQLGAALFETARNAVENLPNAFPPRRTEVPQPNDPNSDVGRIMGFFTDTTLCIGCKACEVACKQWNQLPSDGFNFTGNSYDNTGHLSATTWRHVAFKEKLADDGSSSNRWLMLSDVCKHCESAPCEHSCPTGAIVYNNFGDVYVQNDICNGCGYCISACPFGVLGRADHPHDDGHAHKCTLCMDRQEEDLTPACAKSCPTSSIQFGAVEDLRVKARERVEELHGRGNSQAYLYGCDSVGDYGPLNSFFLLDDHPNEYNLPVAPPQPFRGQGKRYGAALFTGVALAAFTFLSFHGAKRRG
ncbi:MAG TPA: 4Fe-4S dicluster domain-containing protein [Tepidisphaeraceae bacterium]|jgi:formate dehydrogenase iron-sulfur subunit|nr:4Fe-4S dicluster domain-containing protein [Tepidisphaeraceae bacterium]